MRNMNRTRHKLPRNLPQKLKLLLGVLIGIFALSYLSFNDYGIVRHFRIKKELQQLQSKIDMLEKQQVEIHATIDKLKSDNDYIEKLAREKLQMIKKGEELYIIKKNSAQNRGEK